MFYATVSSFLLLVTSVAGHAALVSPKSRNQIARERGDWNIGDYEKSALNNLRSGGGFTNSVCGSVQQDEGKNFDSYVTTNVATYSPGQTFKADVYLRVTHWGHFEFSLCPANNVVFDCPYKLRITRDYNYGSRPTLTNPYKAMVATNTWYQTLGYDVQVPSNIPQGDYVLKFKYVTGNSCSDSTYDRNVLQQLGAPTNLPTCQQTIQPGGGAEIFQNCAQVRVGSGGSPSPPTAPAPAPAPAPSSGGYCSWTGSCSGGDPNATWCNASSQRCSECGGTNYCSGGSGSTTSKLSDWTVCSASTQCNSRCCSGKYSGGVLKCTPLGSNFDPVSNGCVGGRRLRGNAIDEGVNVDGFDVDGGDFDVDGGDFDAIDGTN